MIRGLIFDFDGLIVDTEWPDYWAWVEVFQEHGQALPEQKWRDAIGLAGASTFNPFDDLEAMLGGGIDRSHWRERRHRRYVEMVEAQPILPGVLDYLAEAKQLGLRMGIASSGTNDWVHGHLERLELKPEFEVIFCAGDVQQTKPHPELYLKALDALDLRPDEAIAFEDSRNGSLAAVRAGIPCVVVPHRLTEDLDLSHAHLRLPSLSALSLTALITHLTADGSRV